MVALSVCLRTCAEEVRRTHHEIDWHDLHRSLGAMRHRYDQLTRTTIDERQPGIGKARVIDFPCLRITHDLRRTEHDLRQLGVARKHRLDSRQGLIQAPTE